MLGMKKQNIILALLVIIMAVSAIFLGINMKKMDESRVILYEGPKSLQDATAADLKFASEETSDRRLMHCTDTQVLVNGQQCYVYDTNVNHSRSWSSNYLPSLHRTPVTYFDFSGKVTIDVILPETEIEQAKISPVSYGIDPVIDKAAHKISFTIDQPDTYTVTVNDSVMRAVHIFANPIEEEPDMTDENLIYIGPGEWDIGAITLKSGQTLYIAGGAVVHGYVTADFASDVKILGHGIIDGSSYPGWKASTAFVPLRFDNCNRVEVSGIIALNSNAWVFEGYSTDNLIIDGIKIISARPNGDGISLQSCENAEVTNCFVRSWDDSLVVKNYSKNSKNIRFSNIQLWTDFAQSMEVGYETNKGKKSDAMISDVVFEDIVVLHNFHKPVISVHNADDAQVCDITFKNICVEDCQVGSGDGIEMPYLIDMNIAENANWSSTKERGSIHDITIDGVTVLSGRRVGSRIKGFDEEHKVTNVKIKGLNILDKEIGSFEDAAFEIDSATTGDLMIER